MEDEEVQGTPAAPVTSPGEDEGPSDKELVGRAEKILRRLNNQNGLTTLDRAEIREWLASF